MSLLSRLAVQAARAYGILSSRSNNISADYLVVAGGGGGGSLEGGGGGGGGGFLTSTFTLSTLNTYSITVGAGGNGSPSSSNGTGSNGSNSSVSGTGLTTVTSTGGGGGGGNTSGTATGANGGSGGGGGWVGGGSGYSGGTATSGQGNNGGTGSLSPRRAGGGGGAGAVGASGASSGNGGNGSSSSISGSSVTYAGGGGGGSEGSTGGSGGTGGGGSTTGASAGNGNAGTANTGGGGAGANRGTPGTGTYAGGAGGSGIVIISYTSATPKFVGGTITTSGGKQIHTFTSSGTLSPITPITASYLVVAGGGSSGDNFGGGGGAGGLLTSSTTLYSGATYVVTVGAGASANGAGLSGNQGSNSSVSGTGLTTITATGGGYGGENNSTGGNGGSGGGGGGYSSTSRVGGTGTSGQGNNGGAGGLNSALTSTGGGGGGAGAVGNNGVLAPSASNGNGGIGVSSSISGTATYYAGGGGGGAYGGNPSGAGGQGGGGAGASATNGKGVSGTANTGGGGGGSGGGGAGSGGAAGGSGIVIISYAGSQVFNGGLVTSSGGNTIHTFTSTGALTPLTNNLNNSLRFRSSASAYLSRTPTLTGNRQTFTYSFWTKLGGVISAGGDFISSNNAAGSGDAISLQSSSRIAIAGSGTNFLVTTQLLRDPSAWYHIVVAVDTTQATSANRIKLYINGNQVTAFNTASYPAQNYNFTYWNSSSYAQLIGGGYSYLDGYMTDINFIDGQALEPYYFGNNDANGVWKPIQYKGTYGTNGFYLTFGNTTSTTTLGYDSSPNGNNWTTNNISLTAGTTYDAMTDVPTNTSATVANYPTLNPLSGDGTLSSANLNLSGTDQSRLGTMAFPTTGQWYFEMTMVANAPSTNWDGVGIATLPINTSGTVFYIYRSNGNKLQNGGSNTAYGATYATGDVIGVAYDAGAGTLVFYKNNSSQGTAYTGISGEFFPVIYARGITSAPTLAFNAGQRPFSYTPPTGYVALNTYNLPTPTILQGNKYMDATLYTGNGASTQVIVNQAQFKPDLVWGQARSAAYGSWLFDSVRGATKQISSFSTNAESTQSTMLTAFNSNGFNMGSDTAGNGSGTTFVGWQWQAGQGSTSNITVNQYGSTPSIASTVSVNTTAGFSVLTYTGNNTLSTIGHGLGAAPKFIIVKTRSGTDGWVCYHASLGVQYYTFLNTTAASYNNLANYWGSTAPSSTTFSINAYGGVNTNGATYVAYCWAEIAGFSKFGSYTGNGSADGPFVYTGFRPKFIMTKNTSVADSWMILDTARGTYNVMGNNLRAESSAAEQTNYFPYDILSNGFKLRTSDSNVNTSGNTYIYMAFAEHPAKISNAR